MPAIAVKRLMHVTWQPVDAYINPGFSSLLLLHHTPTFRASFQKATVQVHMLLSPNQKQ